MAGGAAGTRIKDSGAEQALNLNVSGTRQVDSSVEIRNRHGSPRAYLLPYQIGDRIQQIISGVEDHH